MTDIEFIKAIKFCSEDDYCNTGSCPIYRDMGAGEDCITKICEYALDLINRQKAEIEKYEKTVGKLFINDDGTAFATLNGNKTEYITKNEAEIFRNMAVNNAKSEAIKEFAERLKEKADNVRNFNSWQKVVSLDDIDNLVKEMTEPKTKKTAIQAKWDINCDGYYPYCTNCGEEPKSGVMSNFCPNCGAAMTKGEHV